MFDVLRQPLMAGLGSALVAAIAEFGIRRLPRHPQLGRKVTLGIVLGVVLAFIVSFGWFGVRHYERMNMHVTDLAMMDQLVWSTLHGQFMHTTLQGIGVDNFLAFHVEPFMALISPLDLVFPSAALLIVFQVIALGVAAIPIGLWAYKRLDSGFAAVLAAAAFLLQPVISHDNDLLFEQIPLATPFLAWAFYFQLNKRWRWFAACLVLALAVREEVAFIGIALGLYGVVVQRQRAAWLTVSGCALWAGLTLGAIIPHFNGGHGLYWASAYGYLGGDTPATIALGALRRPLLVLSHMLAEPRPYFVLSLLVPLGLLPVLGWRVAWLALPTLAYLLLGDGYYDPNSWYPSPLLPFLAFGAVEGVAALRRWLSPAVTSIYMVTAAAVSFWLLGAGPGSRVYDPVAYQPTAHTAAALAMLRQVPPDAGVSATPQLIAHLSQRFRLNPFPELLIPQDVFAVDFKDWTGWRGYPSDFNDYSQAARRLLRDPSYGGFYQGDGLLLLRRGIFPGPAAHPTRTQFGDVLELDGYDLPERAQAGKPLKVTFHWTALRSPDRQYTVSLQFGNEANGKLAQQDSWPWEGYFPTQEWLAGQRVVDPHLVNLPATLAAGQYRLFVSVYSLQSGQANVLKLTNGESGVAIEPVLVSS